jgi:mono/diheme cytochrome c family protein
MRLFNGPSWGAWLACIAFGAGQSTTLAASTAEGASVKRGEEIALSVCSACHVVAAKQEFPPLLNHPAPPFSEIANRPDTSSQSLMKFILSTHWDVASLPMHMPDPMLSKDQASAVSRYILSLRKH